MSNYPITEEFLMDVATGKPVYTRQWIQNIFDCCDELGIPDEVPGETVECVVRRIMAAYTVKKDK